MSGGYVPEWSLKELAELSGGKVQGDQEKIIRRISTLEHATSDSIACISHPRYRKYLESTAAGAVIANAEIINDCGVNYLISDNPRAAFAKVAACLHQNREIQSGEIHATAEIADSAVIGDNVEIGAYAVIGENVVIGEGVLIGAGCVIDSECQIGSGTRIEFNVSIYRNTKIGSDCSIHAGVVIGASGFSFAQDGNDWLEIPNIGGVIIGDRVRIGAATTIDRGSIENTVIEDGVKIDNNVQIGHNVRIGANTLIVGNSGIAGSAVIGRNCLLGGLTGVVEHVVITDHVIVHSGSIVTRSISVPGTYSSNIPAQEASAWYQVLAKLRRKES